MGQKAALYCRVSISGQSCSRQEWELLEYARKSGFEVVGVWKETSSGSKDQRPERKNVLALAQKRQIDVILVTEFTRLGRSTIDLVHTIHDLERWNVSLLAQTGLQFEVSTPQGKLIASIMATLAEFERDLLREPIRSGIAAAKARGKVFGRQAGQRPKSDRIAPKVMSLIENGRSYRFIASELKISKNTVMNIVHRSREQI